MIFWIGICEEEKKNDSLVFSEAFPGLHVPLNMSRAEHFLPFRYSQSVILSFLSLTRHCYFACSSCSVLPWHTKCTCVSPKGVAFASKSDCMSSDQIPARTAFNLSQWFVVPCLLTLRCLARKLLTAKENVTWRSKTLKTLTHKMYLCFSERCRFCL